MKAPAILRRLTLPTLVLAALGGCSSLEVKDKTVTETAEVIQGPEARPQRSITGFSAALRCMDSQLLDYGVRDVSMLVEEIADETKKVNAGTRDMLISAVSDMTRRSRAVRLVAFGKDAMNVIGFLASAQRQGAYEAVPQYDIKGSVTQLDENLIKNQKDLGFGISPYLNLGIARDAASTVLGLDLSVLTTADMSILPGVTSRNSVVILKQGRGFDGDAAYHKFGVNFSMNLSRSEGQTQALRGLVELAVIELIGKLTKTPYWLCLGADPTNPEIRLEMDDWYYSMAGTRVELIGYFQNQLRRRGFYDGPIDGEFNPAIDEAIANYRVAVGMSREAKLDEEFFRTYLTADHYKIQRPAEPARYVAAAGPAVASPVAATPAAAAAAAAGRSSPAALTLALETSNKQTRFARGEPFSLALTPSRDAYVYCYLQDETTRVTRFFPNRFARDSLVSATRPLAIPGQMRFQLLMNAQGVPETVACFATQRDVMADLPQALVGTDFEPLAGATLDQIRAAFVNASGGTLAQETLDVQVK